MLRTLERRLRLGVRTITVLDQPNCTMEGIGDIKIDQENYYFKLKSYQYPSKTYNLKAVNILFHGYDDHLNRMLKPYANYLAEKEICSIGIDQRGFGKSQGRREYVERFDDILYDTMDSVNKTMEIEKELIKTPAFFMGYSMGAIAALYISIKHPELAKGIICFSPCIKLNMIFGSSILGILKPLLSPFKRRGIGKFPRKLITNDPELIKKIEEDPLAYNEKMRISTAIEIINAGKYLLKNAEKLTTPYLIFQGENDRFGSCEAAKKFHSKTVNVKNKKLALIPEGEHAVLADPKQYEKIKKEVDEWINNLIKM